MTLHMVPWWIPGPSQHLKHIYIPQKKGKGRERMGKKREKFQNQKVFKNKNNTQIISDWGTQWDSKIQQKPPKALSVPLPVGPISGTKMDILEQ